MGEETIAGRYRLLEPLGRGAMSAVWLAYDEELERRVAVKMLAPSADRARFEREARAAAALAHPNICALYDYGESEGRPFMVLEWLPGGSLEERLADRRPLPDEDTRRIAAELADGLAHAHARGLVHRDLKPANVLFDVEGRAKIADFGIARMSGGGTLTEAGTVLGTATYISPEQASGETAGPASDVYSFGVILFRMLTGALPFTSASAMELVRMHRDEPAPPVESVRPDAPPDLAALAAATLRKEPASRPADGAALLAELGGGATAAETHVLAPVAPRPAPPRALLAGLLALLLLGGGIALAVVATRPEGGSPGRVDSTPGLSLPAVPPAGTTTAVPTVTSTPAARTTTAAPATTTARTTTQAATHPATSTAPATTAPATTTAPTTTAPTTTAAQTTTATTTATTAPTTTAETTTVATTTAVTTTAATTTATTG